MSQRPGPLARLDLADILLRQLPALAREVRASEQVWAEQELRDPVPAAETLERIEAEVAAIEPDLRALLRRQSQIALELRKNR